MSALEKGLNLAVDNWKTTGLGISAVLTAIGNALYAHFDGNPETVVNFNVLVPAILSGIALLFARDSDKSSSSTGVK